MSDSIPQIGDLRQGAFAPTWGATRSDVSATVPAMGKIARAPNNLKRLREASGMTQEQAAEAFGLSKSGYVKVEDGERGLKTDRVARAAEIFGVRPADVMAEAVDLAAAPSAGGDPALVRAMAETALRAARLMPVHGEVAAGTWLEVEQDADESRYDPAPITPDPRWRAEAQYGLVVRGTSINKYAIEGDTLHCLDIGATGAAPSNGALVIVERVRDGGLLRERTAKLYHMGEDRMVELRSYSDDPRWSEPIHVPHNVYSFVVERGMTVNMVAIVLGAYRPAPRGLR